MNKYRKIFSQKNKKKNKMRKTLKRNYMLKNKYKKLTNKTNRSSKKNLRKRYQIGCSKQNNMKGGGILHMKAFAVTCKLSKRLVTPPPPGRNRAQFLGQLRP